MSTVLAEIVGFLIVLFVLYRYVLPPLRTMVAQREETIRGQVEEARKAEERLKDAQNQHDEAVQQAENDAARIRDDARADAERIVQEGRERAEEEAERIKRRGEEAIDNSRLQIVRELKAELGGHAGALAERMVREELQGDAAKQASVDSVLGELERMAPADGDRQAAPSHA